MRVTPHVGASVEPPWEMGGAVSGRVRAGQRLGTPDQLDIDCGKLRFETALNRGPP